MTDYNYDLKKSLMAMDSSISHASNARQGEQIRNLDELNKEEAKKAAAQRREIFWTQSTLASYTV